jgi:hypothetical protein
MVTRTYLISTLHCIACLFALLGSVMFMGSQGRINLIFDIFSYCDSYCCCCAIVSVIVIIIITTTIQL